MDDMQRTMTYDSKLKRYVPKSGAGSSSSTTTTNNNNNNNEIVCIDVSPPSKAARVSTSPDGSVVEIVEESWYDKVQKTDSYKTKFEILKGTAYGSPKQAAKQEYLVDFMKEKGKTFFSSKELANRYDEVAGQLKATHSKTKSTLMRDWSAKFCAEKLAILLCLEEQEMKKKTATAASSATAATRSKKKKKAPQVNALKRNYAKLTAVYKKCYKSYTEKKKVDAGKKARTLSLDLQKTGTRIQDSHTFVQGKALPDPCPQCGHCNTMAVGIMTPEAAAAENERLRMASTDGKFKAVSFQAACFCCKTPCTGEDGDDGLTTDCELCLAEMAQDTSLALQDTECKCQCQATFMEVDRRKIALAVAKNKSRGEKEKSGADVKPPPQGTTSSLYYQRMFETIDNNTLRENQHNDGRTRAQVMQDAASRTALDMLTAGVSPGTRRALASEIPLKSNLMFRHPDGSKESMTLAKAKKRMKNTAKADSLQAKQGLNTSFVPSHNTFEANRDTSYSVETVMDPHRRHRNSLSRVPLSVPHHPSAPSAIPQVTQPGVGFGALMNGAASAASASTGGAAASSIPHMAALGDAASMAASASSSTNSAPPKSMNDRVRGRATRAAFTSSTSPRSKRHAKKIRQGLTGGDPDFTTMAEDLPEMNSQEIYGLMVEMVETPTKTPEEELS